MIKLLSDSDLTKIRKKYSNKKIVLCHGVFDLLHFGHIKHLEKAKSLGDLLIVSITASKYVNKGPDRPFFSNEERLKVISSLSIVDFIYLNNDNLSVNIIKKLKPNIYVKGNDYKINKKDVTGGIVKEINALNRINSKIIYTDEIVYSSTNLINRFLLNYNDSQKNIISTIKKKINIEDINKILKSLSKLKVLVVGEPIIDKYIYTSPLGMTNKDAIISTKILTQESFAGGSLAIANNLKSLGCDTSVIYPAAKDVETKKIIKKNIIKGIKLIPIELHNWQIPVKTRYINKSHMKKLFETNEIYEEIWNNNSHDKFFKKFNKNITDYDIVFVSDFGHGFFDKKIVKKINECKIFTSLNVQTNSSNLGFNYYTKFNKYNLLSIDERELKLGIGVKNLSGIDLIKYALKNNKIKVPFSITMGDKGSIFVDSKKNIYSSPIFFENIVDTVGAGDAYFAIVSLLSKIKTPNYLIPFLGNCFAGLKTKIVANKKPVSLINLYKTLNSILG